MKRRNHKSAAIIDDDGIENENYKYSIFIGFTSDINTNILSLSIPLNYMSLTFNSYTT